MIQGRIEDVPYPVAIGVDRFGRADGNGRVRIVRGVPTGSVTPEPTVGV